MDTKEKVSNEQLREKLRNYAAQIRNCKRREKTDLLRPGLGEICAALSELENLTEKDVAGIAGRIKRKKHADTEDMFRLCHAFLQSEENIIAFTKITGAVDIIAKEFISTTSDTQVVACEVLCNITLGNTVCCQKVAKLAGCYLASYLSGSHLTLIQTCLWTLSNIVCEPKAAEIVLAHELVPKLIYLTKSKAHRDVHDDVMATLDLLLERSHKVIRDDDLSNLQEELLPVALENKIPIKILYHVLFIKNRSEYEDQEIILAPIIKLCIKTLNSCLGTESCDNFSQVLYSIRILGNLVVQCSFATSSIFEECQVLQALLSQILNFYFAKEIQPLTKELLWLVSCLSKNTDYVQYYMEEDDLLANIKVAKKSTLKVV